MDDPFFEQHVRMRMSMNEDTTTPRLQATYAQACRQLAFEQMTTNNPNPCWAEMIESRKRILEARGEPLCPTTPIAPATHP